MKLARISLAAIYKYATFILLVTILFACNQQNKLASDNQSSFDEAVKASTKDEFFLGGQVIGLRGTVHLSFASGHQQEISNNGSFKLTQPLKAGSEYQIAIDQQPEGQTCILQNQTGKVARADISTLVLVCFDQLPNATEITIAGSIIALTGPIKIMTADQQTINVTQNGDFSATIKAKPETILPFTIDAGTSNCVITSSRTDAATSSYHIEIDCRNSAKIELFATGIVVQRSVVLNDQETLSITKNGHYSFTNAVPSGSDFEVRLAVTPTDQTCSLKNANGKVANNITTVWLQCGPMSGATINITAQSWTEQVRLEWNDVGADSYNIYYNSRPDFTIADYATDPTKKITKIAAVASPIVVNDLSNGENYTFFVEGVFPGHSSLEKKISAKPIAIEFDHQPRAVRAGQNGRIYLGGDFSSIGFKTSSLIQTKTSTTPAQIIPEKILPEFDRTVNAVASDGKGGWYVGGNFTSVDGNVAFSLAHITANGEFDKDWRHNISNGSVYALAVYDGRVYVGGSFTQIDNIARRNFAVIDSNGSIVTTFAEFDDIIRAITIEPSLLYPVVVGGSFGNVIQSTGPIPMRGLVSLSFNGSPYTDWSTVVSNVGGTVYAIAVIDNVIFAGGSFVSTAGNNLVGITANSGQLIFNSAGSPNNTVYAMTSYGTSLLIGGAFDLIGQTTRRGLASFDYFFGEVREITLGVWNPTPSFKPVIGQGINDFAKVTTMTLNLDQLYIAGEFDYVSGQRRNSVAAFDLRKTDWPLNNWDPVLSSISLTSIAANLNDVVVGGTITTVGGVRREKLAAIEANGILSDWNPIQSSDITSINVIETNRDAIFFAGNFQTINQQTRLSFAAVDHNGKLLDINFNIPGTVSALHADDAWLTVSDVDYGEGGSFTTLRRFNLMNNSLAWTQFYDGSIYDIGLFENRIILAGNFTFAASSTNQFLAALDFSGQEIQNFPVVPPNNAVVKLFPYDTQLIASGYSIFVEGQTRRHFAAYNADGTLSSWNPGFNDSPRAASRIGNEIYFGGYFRSVGNETREALAAFDNAGNLIPWNPLLDGSEGTSVDDLTSANDTIYVVGDITAVNGRPRKDFAAIDIAGNVKTIPFFKPPWEQ